jgi:hypothetical protein
VRPIDRRASAEHVGVMFTRQVLDTAIYLQHPRLTWQFIARYGRFPRISCPIDANEKMLWRKLFDRNPKFVEFSDKIRAKEYVKRTIPGIRTADVIWQGLDIASVPNSILSSRCWIKATHGSGMNVRLGDGAVDFEKLQQTTRRWLKHRHHKPHGEWGYSKVQPKLFIEKDVSASGVSGVVDIIIYVFCGKVLLMAVTTGEKTGEERVGLFGPTGERLKANPVDPLTGRLPEPLPPDYQLPVPAEVLCDLAIRIADDCDHLRVDFMWNGQALYFCEGTVYPGGGYRAYTDEAIIDDMTKAWDIGKSWLLTSEQKGRRRWYAQWLKAELREYK